jgi:NAD(P)-dependent dehydrogenase (short-subunit alcohol dehydrogenase family)
MQHGPPTQTAYITGAGSGIGRALACALAARGSGLALFDRQFDQASRAQILAARSSDAQPAQFHIVDITDAPAVRAAVDQACREIGPPQLAVNCAGINATRNFERLDDETFARVINVNLLGSRHFARAVLPHMGQGAQLTLIASMAGLVGNYAYAAYSASKFGVVGLANVLRVEYRPLGIDIAVVCPPEVPTPMVEKEMRHEHPVQRKLKDTAGVISLDQVVRAILDNTGRRRRFMVVPGARAQFTYALARFVPLRLLHLYVDAVVRRVLAQHPDAPRR